MEYVDSKNVMTFVIGHTVKKLLLLENTGKYYEIIAKNYVKITILVSIINIEQYFLLHYLSLNVTSNLCIIILFTITFKIIVIIVILTFNVIVIVFTIS